MSALPVRAADEVREPSRLTRAGSALHLVPGSTPRLGGGTFGLLVVTVLVVGLVALLLLNTVLAQGAFTVHQRQATADALEVQQQTLAQAVAALETPDSLEHRARALGMVPSTTPVFLRLSDRRVLGVATPAPGASRAAAPAPAPTASASSTARPATPAPAGAAVGAAVKAPEGAEVAAPPAGDGAAAVTAAPGPGSPSAGASAGASGAGDGAAIVGGGR